MADYAARAAVAKDVPFRDRVTIAVAIVALEQSSEATPHPMWTRKRLDLATLVLKDPQASAARFALILAAWDVPATATDDVIQDFVRQAWDAVSGVGQEDRGNG